MTEKVECVVVGAGVVGLAVARAVALSGKEVLLLEKEPTFGTETSSRNSEVIHAGIYYEPGSLKAALCVRGKALLYTYLRERGIGVRPCGKLVVATSADEVSGLEFYQNRGRENGVHDLELISGADAQGLEPMLVCEAALVSPSTGIFDSHNYMLSLLGDFENAGGMVAFNAPFVEAHPVESRICVQVGGDEPLELDAKYLINCAGLYATEVARRIDGLSDAHIVETRYAKGRYFMISGKPPFSRLIYPMPTNDSQGTHYTCDLGGQGRLGPDIIWDVARGDYEVEETARTAFAEAARRYLPSLQEENLQPSYAGLRPKIGPPGEWMDFRIDTEDLHGVTGLVNLFGIESPGLTSSLAIGEYVAERL